MRLLFLHQNFPGQYRWLAPSLGADPANNVVAIGDKSNLADWSNVPGVRLLTYDSPAGPSAETHHYIRNLEAAVRRGQQVLRLCIDLRKEGFVPEVIIAHPGWGDALYVKDIFPEAKLLNFCEFYYHSSGIDVGFDPEFPAPYDDLFRVRTKNSVNLFSLVSCDWAIAPTRWQWQVHPAEFRPKMSVIFDGIETDLIKPNREITATLQDGRVLTRADEVITFVNRNLEPYRGWHIFARTIPEIQRRRPRAHVLVIGGDGLSYGANPKDGRTYKETFLAEIQDRIDPSRLHFLGKIPFTQYLGVMQLSSAHVYLTYPFVLSWSMIEAMAIGCPVIGSRTRPVEEVIVHERNGLLVDFFSPAEIADSVDRVLDHPDRMRALGERARQTVIDRYDLKGVCLPQHISLISNLAVGRLPEPSVGGPPVFAPPPASIVAPKLRQVAEQRAARLKNKKAR